MMVGPIATRIRLLTWRPGIGALLALAAVLSVFGTRCDITPAHAQYQPETLRFPARPQPLPPSAATKQRQSNKAPMLLQAREMQYDYANERVSAVGNVQVYYGGATLEADKVIYDQKTKRLHAEGNVRLTESDGKIIYGQYMDLSDDFRDGFVDSLRLDAPEQTRFAAARADRTGGNFTVFNSGVYTACEPCKDDPKKPPFWQVKAARIIHNESEKMIYFEDARLEFMGIPTMYMPYFSAPDPTVKRKTGWLAPVLTSTSKYGVGVSAPYYIAVAPDRDVTITPFTTTKQGPLLQAEYRQRFENGSLMVRGSGIYQWKPETFVHADGTPTPGNTRMRGSFESSGQFALSSKWTWGWDAIAPSDKTYFQDYGLYGYRTAVDPLRFTLSEGVSQAYVVGKGDRSYFDLRSIYYYGFSEADAQGQIPVIHPVMDYSYIFNRPIFGGELGYNVNFTSLSRQQASFDPISQTAFTNSLCLPTSADPAARIPANCVLRGFPGTYSRFSAETYWRRSITDSFGQVFTPFVRLRGDVAALSVKSDPGVSNYIAPGDSTETRMMPTAGLEYRYPFINVQSWGTQTIEPIAQLIMRPNEQRVGQFPNEDSQSLIFDDSNLFREDKFAGWDRVEGGGRANVGVQYTAQANRGGTLNVLFGQSYQLFGLNSFATGDATNTGLGSGLDTSRSDYVARVSFQPDRMYTFTTRYRFDESSFAVRRFEAETRANLDRWIVTVLYGYYAAQPQIGFLTSRNGILGSMSYKLSANWIATSAIRYDLEADQIQQYQIGVGYIDDCFLLALNYITDYGYSGNPTTDHRIMLQMSLRTLGGSGVSQNVGGLGAR
jgi:LPS-assembly protein